MAPLDSTYQLLGGGIDGSIGAMPSWVLGCIAVAAVAFSLIKARNKRARYAPKSSDDLLGYLGVLDIP